MELSTLTVIKEFKFVNNSQNNPALITLYLLNMRYNCFNPWWIIIVVIMSSASDSAMQF